MKLQHFQIRIILSFVFHAIFLTTNCRVTFVSFCNSFTLSAHCLFSPLCSKPCSSQHKHRVDNAFFTFYFLTWGKETTDFNIQFMESGTHFSKIQMSSVTDQGDFWHELQVPLQRQPKGLLGPPYT